MNLKMSLIKESFMWGSIIGLLLGVLGIAIPSFFFSLLGLGLHPLPFPFTTLSFWDTMLQLYVIGCIPTTLFLYMSSESSLWEPES